MIGLAGCVGSDLRKGPSPVLDATAVANASNNKAWVMYALECDAGYCDRNDVDYSAVAEAGFNYVDDQCNSYFNQLFFIDRGRSQIKSGLAATDATTTAILGITGAAVPTLTIVAAAFGLASAATDIIAGTYLYALPPATTQGFVTRQQKAFRDGVFANRDRVNSRSTAYYVIQRYLMLCLPPTIEGEIAKQIASTQTFPVREGGGALFSLETASMSSLALLRSLTAPTVLKSATTPLKPTKPIVDRRFLPPDRFNVVEAGLSLERIRRIQVAVCVEPVDNVPSLGSVGSITRRNIVEFFEGLGRPRTSVNSRGGGLTARDVDVLMQAFSERKDGCSANGIKSPREAGQLLQ